MNGGIVVAAGASTRFGSPKALAPLRGAPAIERAARVLQEGGCDEVVVVLGAQAERIRGLVPKFAKLVVNERWSQGRTGTIKAGARALSANASMCVLPLDHPAIDAATVRALLKAPGLVRVPTFEGQRGHPPFFEARLRPELLALGDDEPLHEVLYADPKRVVEVPVADPGILMNMDTPEDWKKISAYLEGRTRARPVA